MAVAAAFRRGLAIFLRTGVMMNRLKQLPPWDIHSFHNIISLNAFKLPNCQNWLSQFRPSRLQNSWKSGEHIIFARYYYICRWFDWKDDCKCNRSPRKKCVRLFEASTHPMYLTIILVYVYTAEKKSLYVVARNLGGWFQKLAILLVHLCSICRLRITV